ncbi:Tctex-1 family protein [Ancylostoma duodenale]|uniref:Tctex-1 family protein n=1 Tax=Ancylostoma duodenale TaxID=51022 RepID=A0A0C2G783_9BILA|nr:Tctex-1 family protein [Ancylostoma duodenale]
MADVKNTFTQEEVQGIIKQVLDEVIGLSPYNYADSLNWNKQAVEQITKRLVALNRPYKYIESWQYRWETKNMLVVVYVYALATS